MLRLIEINTDEVLVEIPTDDEVNDCYVSLELEDSDRIKLSKDEYLNIRQLHINRIRAQRGVNNG